MRVVGASVIFSAVAGAAAAPHYARGYVRSAHREVLAVAEVTEEDLGSVPQSIDWSAKGATSAVKNQGGCGSCWAFSTTEGVESAVFMATGEMPVLSTQQIISCDSSDYGCNGGDPATALNYIEQAGGLDVASDYPDTSHQTGETGQCTWDKQEEVVVTSWKYAIPACESGKCKNQDEDKLAAALTKYGPLSICVNANYWDPYTSGVFDCGHNNEYCSGAARDLDHCVQLVGFDKSGSSPYWKVRNSWGTGWGEDGFIRLPYGINACGVADEAYIIEATPKQSVERHARGYTRAPRDESLAVVELSDEDLEQAPESIDWSEKGATSAIKNQGDCGSCWAFSTTEGIESAIFMATGEMPELSTQQIISCDSSDYGCGGGDPATALKYVESAGGLDTASDYPDTSHESGETGKCSWDKKEAGVVTSWKYAIPPCESGKCTSQDEDKLAAALAKHGPLSICVNANYWDPYTSGVFNCGKKNKHCSGAASDLDHCVQLVGYDRGASSPYWKVRNSWGTSWGESGFIRLPYGINACGVADEAYIIHAEPASGATVTV